MQLIFSITSFCLTIGQSVTTILTNTDQCMILSGFVLFLSTRLTFRSFRKRFKQKEKQEFNTNREKKKDLREKVKHFLGLLCVFQLEKARVLKEASIVDECFS